VAFLVVKFLRAYVLFQAIDKEFESFARAECLDGCALFERVRELVIGHLFDLKERAHALFRSERSAAGSKRPSARSSSETRSLDSLIGTGYHLALILQESLYQVERYTPELEKEKDELSARVAAESAELAIRVEERCRAVFKGIAEVVHKFLARAHDNEILVLNLVQNADLLEKVYGEGSAEKIFSAVCTGRDLAGTTAFERALSFVRARCGNITALPPAPGGAAGAPAGAAGAPAGTAAAPAGMAGRTAISRASAS
jgi:hypothetical protein